MGFTFGVGLFGDRLGVGRSLPAKPSLPALSSGLGQLGQWCYRPSPVMGIEVPTQRPLLSATPHCCSTWRSEFCQLREVCGW